MDSLVVKSVLHKIFGTSNDRDLKRIWPMVAEINAREKAIKALSDSQLQAKTNEFKEILEKGASLDDILFDAFSVVREASVRVLGMRHFDVQLLGGIVLHSGKIAEMKTGEGKTLTATAPVFLNALTSKGVHLVTVNDYLASRDAEWMGQLYRFLGLSTGCVLSGLDPDVRQQAYNSDITYGQNNEFGFDYLRDNMKLDLSERAQRGHSFAIVDEVDSILIDEARTPLIISGPSDKPADTYQIANKLVQNLVDEKHYEIEIKSKQVTLSEEGVTKIEELAEISNLYDPQNIELVHHVQQALRANVIMKRDVDYVARNGQIIIVDEFTGRLMTGRRWSDGLHQAVEAKEGVKIQRENQTLATITFQNYFRRYDKLAGMTGTADTEAVEFKKIYNLEVIVVPTNEKMLRDDRNDLIFLSERAKFKAVVEDIRNCREKGQPVLVGTASIEKSELLGSILDEEGIEHHVLNAKQHQREAQIIAQAGRIGALTISTNMAGRGTDILLGGNPQLLAVEKAGTSDPDDPAFQEALAEFKELCAKEKEEVKAAGGLHILGTERHESRRIDNQLRGRAGRQGDAGSSQFFISFEDDLMKRFGGEAMRGFMLRVAGDDDEGIQGRTISGLIEKAQRRVEGHHFEIRKHLLEYDDVLSKQREVVYGLREEILAGKVTSEQIVELIGDIVEQVIYSRISDKMPVREWDIEGILSEFSRACGVTLPLDEYNEEKDSGRKDLAQRIFDDAKQAICAKFENRLLSIGPDRMLHLARLIYLQSIDYFWKDHLTQMDHLREGIGLRGYGQKNPLHEYQREGYDLFYRMMGVVKFSLIQHVMLAEIPSEEEIRQLEEKEKEQSRLREEAASELHSSMVPSSESEEETVLVGNRDQRRAQKKANKGKKS